MAVKALISQESREARTSTIWRSTDLAVWLETVPSERRSSNPPSLSAGKSLQGMTRRHDAMIRVDYVEKASSRYRSRARRRVNHNCCCGSPIFFRRVGDDEALSTRASRHRQVAYARLSSPLFTTTNNNHSTTNNHYHSNKVETSMLTSQDSCAHLSSSPSRPSPPPWQCPSPLSSSSLLPSWSFSRPNKLLVSQVAATCGSRDKSPPSPSLFPASPSWALPFTRSSKYPARFSATGVKKHRCNECLCCWWCQGGVVELLVVEGWRERRCIDPGPLLSVPSEPDLQLVEAYRFSGLGQEFSSTGREGHAARVRLRTHALQPGASNRATEGTILYPPQPTLVDSRRARQTG